MREVIPGGGQRFRMWHVARGIAALLSFGVVCISCGGSPSSAPHVGTAATPSGPASVPEAAVTGPVTGGTGIDLPGTTSFDLSTVGYEQNEYFLSGRATTYTSVSPLSSNGRWTVAQASAAPYKTRMVVYRPINAKRFDGTVIVEWLNVSGGVDAAAAWLTDHVQMVRSGMAYVGVSAQATGIVGAAGSLGASAGQVGGIKGADPVRYGSLEHPGDSYSYSIFEQAGAAVRRDAARVLGGLEPSRILALGESQSAARLVTYIDALQPQSRGVYDGYFVYSRFGSGQPSPRRHNPPSTLLLRPSSAPTSTCRS